MAFRVLITPDQKNINKKYTPKESRVVPTEILFCARLCSKHIVRFSDCVLTRKSKENGLKDGSNGRVREIPGGYREERGQGAKGRDGPLIG